MPADQLICADSTRLMDAGTWPQYLVQSPDRDTAERIAVQYLWPIVRAAETSGRVTRWWFVRKTPHWRLRFEHIDAAADQVLTGMLNDLAAQGTIVGWSTGRYEPETLAFGGPAAMNITHTLFHQDSRSVLNQLVESADEPRFGRRELAVLLISTLLRGAGLDWYEQGDVWAKAAEHRPPLDPVPGPRAPQLVAVRRLLYAETRVPASSDGSGPLTSLADWFAAFHDAGRGLADLARRGALERGLRAVLAHHVIFHFNRIGLTYAEQHALTTLAKVAIMDAPDNPVSDHATQPNPPTLSAVTHDPEAAPSPDPATLRRRLADRLRTTGAARTAPVDAALTAVPRHLFLPDVPIEQAYSDQPVATKHDADGAAISAASEPTIVTTMLEQLGVEPGHRILEIGAGTGYNAALLAHLTGDHGHVTTIDVDDDIVTAARAHLAAAGIGNVTVLLGDGALGHPDAAPYDRIIATVGAWNLPATWRQQLTPGGRIVVPLRLRGSIARSTAFERDTNGAWVSRSSYLCTFMPLRGIADDARRNLPITPDATVAVETHHDQQVDSAALTGILDHPASTVWTGVTFTGSESFEWLDLWLACTMDNAISRMPVQLAAIDAGLVTPQFGWGSMAVIAAADLAYLTLRPAHDSGRYEVGLVGHGPNADQLAHAASTQIQAWDHDHRDNTVDFQVRAAGSTPAETPPPGTTLFTFARPDAQLVITWRRP